MRGLRPLDRSGLGYNVISWNISGKHLSGMLAFLSLDMISAVAMTFPAISLLHLQVLQTKPETEERFSLADPHAVNIRASPLCLCSINFSSMFFETRETFLGRKSLRSESGSTQSATTHLLQSTMAAPVPHLGAQPQHPVRQVSMTSDQEALRF